MKDFEIDQIAQFREVNQSKDDNCSIENMEGHYKHLWAYTLNVSREAIFTFRLRSAFNACYNKAVNISETAKNMF